MSTSLNQNTSPNGPQQNTRGINASVRSPRVFEREHVRPIAVFARHTNGLEEHLARITSELKSGDAAKEIEAINTFFRDVVLRLRFADLTPEQVRLFIATLYEEQISLPLKLEVLYSLRIDYTRMTLGCREVIEDLSFIAVDQNLPADLRYEALYTLLDIYITENRFRKKMESNEELTQIGRAHV